MRPQIVKNIATTVLSILASTVMLGQARDASSGPPTPGRGPLPPIDLSLPIDSNILILVVLGLAFGIYSLVKSKFKNTAS
ncbi:hypothetical protein SAMN05421855_101882 [Ulvibacter litoralis]|uniref:Uncharacterized protein n=1 Tax=Ulvibacter litoralis TaxID=227084 RepID=A0A1G7DDC6_9FLAO|nr:hypothetical protein GCM10008083_03260 [Ulvibacter litoralis]SDE48990.1 hypothetical protein SAMN05421855_101882 [Ulvibacter litoralis]